MKEEILKQYELWCAKADANAVVVEDIPSNTTVVMQKPRYISRLK